MKLHSFQIKNYKSIIDTKIVQLSDHDNITILAGQNESGKSSILEALNAYEVGEFELDSKPFTTKGSLVQSVDCTYEIVNHEEFVHQLDKSVRSYYETGISDEEPLFDEKKLSTINFFTITRFFPDNEGGVSLKLNKDVFEIFRASILYKEVEVEEKKEDGSVEKKISKIKIFDIPDEDIKDVASIFKDQTSNIVLFNDFCDLLPDSITLADLKNKKTDAKGYRAVKNIESILGIDFVSLYQKEDLEREAIRDEHNNILSVNFQKAWGQKIHNTNKVEVKYSFEKRETDDTSYINFCTETKDRQKLKPHQRSKGLIWFLSFWIELEAQNSKHNQLIILADEPGLYLHVKAQSDILQLFKKLSSEGHQIIYSTHSPNLIESKHLNRINLVLNDSKDGTILEPVTTSKIDNKNKQDALQPVANAIGFSVSDFALSTKKSLIVEGVSDHFYYIGMRKLLSRKDDYSIVPGIGCRKQQTLISFCVGYGIDWVAIFDDDSSRGSDSQKTFDDIEKYFFDGNKDVAKTKMYLTKGISSVENMFSNDDIKLVDPGVVLREDASKTIGNDRKVIFSKFFYEKVVSGEIKKSQLQPKTIANFKSAFDWVDLNLEL